MTITGLKLIGAVAMVAGLSACATGVDTAETQDDVKAREAMAVEAARSPSKRGTAGRPKYQNGEEREALQRTLTACVEAVDAELAALPADVPLADREAVLQKQRELSKLKSHYAAIEARRQANIDRLQDRNASYGAPFSDPALNSRAGLVANYAPYAENESTQFPGVPAYCLTTVEAPMPDENNTAVPEAN